MSRSGRRLGDSPWRNTSSMARADCGIVRRVLEQHHVAARARGARRGTPARTEVPRHDREHHAKRLIPDVVGRGALDGSSASSRAALSAIQPAVHAHFSISPSASTIGLPISAVRIDAGPPVRANRCDASGDGSMLMRAARQPWRTLRSWRSPPDGRVVRLRKGRRSRPSPVDRLQHRTPSSNVSRVPIRLEPVAGRHRPARCRPYRCLVRACMGRSAPANGYEG
jgi:hypothetical protein